MNSSRHASAARPVPLAPPAPGSTAYTRFIPREELRSFAAWRPGSFGDVQDLAPAPWAPPASAMAPARRAKDPRQGDMQAGLAGLPDTALAAARAPLTQPQPPADPGLPAAAPDPAPAQAEPAVALPTLEELHAEMQAEMQQQVAAARTQGYQDGYRDGLVALESFKQSFASQVSSQVAQVVHALDTELGQLEQQMAASLARVATELARQVVRSELSVRPALVAQVAREAVNAVLASARQIHVLVHPDDHALVAAGCEDALLARGARLLAQANIARGGCRVESDAGTVDARVAARWTQATHALGTGVAWDDEPAGEGRPGGDA